MIVTISREFGAGAVGVARIVAERCGFRLVVDELPLRVGERLGVSADEVVADEERPQPLLERLAMRLAGSALDVQTIPDGEVDELANRMRRAVEEALREEAFHGDVVIVGHAAGHVLGRKADTVRIFLHAPLAWRVDRVAEWLGLPAQEAQAEVIRIDRARAAYVAERYDARWDDPRSYDLTIDTSRMPLEAVGDLVISTVAGRYEQQ